MANPLSVNETSSQNHYSDSMPVIGFYIAGATMVCFVLILCDIISGIRHRKLWFPCRYFSLNSVTLILLFVSSKIPMDLTTSMPSAQDQLSKFTGTAILCIFMCFFYPSVGANSAPNNTNNMVALSIVVITVIVNIFIQMSTGVIFSFILENVILMFFMLTLLCNLWLCSLSRNAEKDILFDRNKEIFIKGKGSLLRRLEACYLHGCNSNPQFVSCTTLSFKYVSCFISGSILLFTAEVTLRSLVAYKLRFGSSRFSDYGWSMWIIVATQILVILLGASATAVRLLVTVVVDKPRDNLPKFFSHENKIWLTETIPFLRADVAYYLISFLEISLFIMMILIEVILFLPTAAFYCTFSFACYLAYRYRPSEQIEEYTDLLLENGISMNPRMKKKCVEEMKRWKSVNGTESQSHLTQLLSRTPPSQPSLEQLSNQFHLNRASFKVSCLYLVFLARIASVLTLSRGNLLVESLREVFDIIHFVDTRVNSLEVDSRKKGTFAKFLWRKFFISSSASPQVVPGSTQDQSNVACALRIINESQEAISPYYVRQEVSTFVDFIKSRDYTSTEEIYAYLEQVFVDMLHIFLIQLPEVIFKEVTESSVDQYEKRVRRMLKFAERVRHLENKVEWSFLNVATKITSLTTDQTSTVSTSTASTSTTSLGHDNCRSWVINNFVEGEDCCCCGTFCNQSGWCGLLRYMSCMLCYSCRKRSCCEIQVEV